MTAQENLKLIQDLDNQWIGEYGVTRGELSAAFKKVQNSENWKLPIYSSIDIRDQEIVKNAIIFFTGSVPTFHWVCGKTMVKAAGYYAAVGA